MYKNKIAFSADSQSIAGLDEKHGVIVEPVGASARAGTSHEFAQTGGPAADLSYAANGALAIAYPKGECWLWQPGSGVRESLAKTARDTSTVLFSVDGARLVLLGPAFIDWLEVKQRRWTPLVVTPAQKLKSATLSHGAGWLAAGTEGGDVLLYSLSDSQAPRVLAGHTRPIVGLAFDDGDEWLASASSDSIRVWSLRDLNASPLRLNPAAVRYAGHLSWNHSDAVSAVQFLGNGRLAAAIASWVAIWDLDPDRLVATACAVAGRRMQPAEIANYLDGSAQLTCANNALRRPH
jgi:WD40 repeat protein